MSNQTPMRFWDACSSYGQKPEFQTSADFWAAAREYFAWVEDHPLFLDKGFSYQGKVSIEKFPKMRPMTINGLCLFLGISREDFEEYGMSNEFHEIIQRIKDVVFEQKFAGAATESLNSALVVRDLGLSEKRELSGSDCGSDSTGVSELSAHELALKMFAFVREGEKELARAKPEELKQSDEDSFRRYRSRDEDDGREVVYTQVVQPSGQNQVSE